MSFANDSMQNIINIASQTVEEYGEQAEQWLQDHHDVKECWECEEWLECGLDAFRITASTDALIRKGAEQDKYDLTHELQRAVISLYEHWLAPSELAEGWIDSLSQRGQPPKYAQEIRVAIAQARQIVKDRTARLQKINSVNEAMLSKLAETHRPPDAWFDGQG